MAVTQKFGMSILEFEVLEFCDPENCIAVEQRYIDQHPRRLLYNTNPIAGSRRGSKLSKEQRKLLSERHGGISSASDLEKIISDYAEGASQTELAAKYGVNRSSIRNYLTREGAPMRPRPGKNNDLRLMLIHQYQDNKTARELATMHKLDLETVIRILGHAGVRVRSQSERQKLRFELPGQRRKISIAKGGRIFHFIHRVHGRFSGHLFEFAKEFGIKNSGTLSQLASGKRLVYLGWELTSADCVHSWKRPEVREYLRGDRHHSYGRGASPETKRLMSLRRWKLTPDQISQIIMRIAHGEKQTALALEYGVHQTVISRIHTKARGYASL
jgi:transposase